MLLVNTEDLQVGDVVSCANTFQDVCYFLVISSQYRSYVRYYETLTTEEGQLVIQLCSEHYFKMHGKLCNQRSKI